LDRVTVSTFFKKKNVPFSRVLLWRVKWVVVPLYAMLEQATERAIFGRPVGLQF
jgi:hypothetical protein